MSDDSKRPSGQQSQQDESADSQGAKNEDDAIFSGSETELVEIERSRSGCLLGGFSVLAVLSGLLVLVLLFAPQPQDYRGANHPAVGTKLSTLSLDPLTGESETTQLKDLEGKVVLINYWGVWCGPCHMEFPYLLAIEKRFHDQSEFRFLSVSCLPTSSGSEKDLRDATVEFLEGQKTDLPTYSDMKRITRIGLLEELGESMDFTYPTTVVLDRKGVIRGLWRNYHPDDTDHAEQLVQDLLNE